MEPPSDVPRTLGRYQLLARIATGGMGEVFLARLEGAEGFEKLYAVKRILPHLASEQRFRTMLISEAQIAARMSHPNICQVYELGESDGQLYIAMEYLEGTSLHGLLRARQKTGQLELGCIATLFRQACDALHHAHELRDREGATLELVHRDVSPGNIFICASGAVKVLDFGIAKVKHGQQTQTGTVKGKYAYMAPEQLRGGELARTVDVFALGAVLFEMLALRRLFQRDTDYLTFRAVLEDPLPLVRRYRFDASEDLARAVERALAREPSERWPTARAFCDAVLAAIPDKLWSEDQVGELVRSSMAVDLAHTSDAIKTVILKGGVPLDATAAPLTNISADDLPAVEPTSMVAPPAETPRKSRAWIYVLVVAVLIAGPAIGIATYLARDKPAQEPIVIRTEDATTRESDMKAVLPYMATLNECASKHPTTLAATTATITIGTNGRTSVATFAPVIDTALGDCMLAVLSDVKFTTRNAESVLSLTIKFPKRG